MSKLPASTTLVLVDSTSCKGKELQGDPCRFSIESYHYHMLPDIVSVSRSPPPLRIRNLTDVLHAREGEEGGRNPVLTKENASPLSFSSSSPPSSIPAWLLAAGRSPAEFHRRHVSLWFMRLARGKTTNPPSLPVTSVPANILFDETIYALSLFQFYLSYFFFFLYIFMYQMCAKLSSFFQIQDFIALQSDTQIKISGFKCLVTLFARNVSAASIAGSLEVGISFEIVAHSSGNSWSARRGFF